MSRDVRKFLFFQNQLKIIYLLKFLECFLNLKFCLFKKNDLSSLGNNSSIKSQKN